MNKIFNFLLLGMFVLGTTLGFATDTAPDTLKGVISRVVTFPIGHHKDGGFYILDNHYGVSFETKRDKAWKEGDAVLIKNPFEEMDNTKKSVDVKNITHNDKKTLTRVGWVSPQSYKIAEISSHQERDGNNIHVNVLLDDGTKWEMVYNDHKPKAQCWQVGDVILLIVNPLEGHASPFPMFVRHSHYEYNLINLSSKNHYAEINAVPVL